MAIELIPREETQVETTTEAPATAEVIPPAEPKKGKGRPPGSKNKSKSVPEAPPEPEPVAIEPALPIPIEKKKRQARKIPSESIPEAAPAPTPPAPTPSPPSPMIAVVPDRPRPEDMLRQLQQDARQRLTDSYNIRREGWTAELNRKYK